MDNNKLKDIDENLTKIKDKLKKKKEKEIEKKKYIEEQTYPYRAMAKLSPFFGLVIGKIRSGKSRFVGGFVSYAQQNKTYERIMVVSPTIHTGFWSKLGIKKNNQIEDISEDKLLELQEYRKNQKNRKEWLMIFDDILAGNNARSKGLVKLVSVLRHFNISCLIICQNCKKIDPVFRTNADFVATYRIIGDENLKILFRETSMGENMNEWIDKYLESTTDNHCLFINNNENDLQKRCVKYKTDLKYWKVP